MSRAPVAHSGFVPNLGQWEHGSRFVHRGRAMNVFLSDRGWLLDLVGPAGRGVAVRMSFPGAGARPELIGEDVLPGHHNYFLGTDANRWRTHVPRFAAVRYAGLYPGVDVRLRHAGGHLEYDLLLGPGTDLSAVSIRVEGASGLRLAAGGALVIETALGPIRQPVAKTWEVLRDGGAKRELACRYVVRGDDRFGFEVQGRKGDARLTIDPGLIWSTHVGGNLAEYSLALGGDADGRSTVVGYALSATYPTTTGAYDRTFNGVADAIVTRLDPKRTGAAQLDYSTFLGGSLDDYIYTVAVDDSGVVSVFGHTNSTNFPTTTGAFDKTHNGKNDLFVCQLDPSKSGASQLAYSTYLGGSEFDEPFAIATGAGGVITVAGHTFSLNFPVTGNAYDSSYNSKGDAIVARLDPRKTGAAQLLYSTFLGGSGDDYGHTVSFDPRGIVTLGGHTTSSNLPTTSGAFDTTYNGNTDSYVSRLDLNKTGAAQLVYSTYLGGTAGDSAFWMAVDGGGIVTIVGSTESANYPTSANAYDRSANGGIDSFITRLDPTKTAQLLYSTFLGGSGDDNCYGLFVDGDGVLTVCGTTRSTDHPTTQGAYDTTHNGGFDGFVGRLDPRAVGPAQLLYGTYLGGTGDDNIYGLSVDGSGVATVAGDTLSSNYPTTQGAYDPTANGKADVVVSRLDMGVALRADLHRLSLRRAGTQNLTLNAGAIHANRSYWIFGSVTGTWPGITLGGVPIPLNPDVYTDVTLTAANTLLLSKFKGTLDANGAATASFNVPSGLPPLGSVTLHHAFIVYDAQGRFYLASNAVPLGLEN